jgi:hypothetical protein
MSGESKPVPVEVEKLYPFVMRSRGFIVGRQTLARSRSQLHFILLTEDISENSRNEILRDYAPYPIVQVYRMEDIERFFGLHGTRVIGFQKGGLAKSIYAHLKPFRINLPGNPSVAPAESESGSESDSESKSGPADPSDAGTEGS